MAFANIRRKIKAIQEFDIIAETIDIINQNSELLSELLREQLSQGLDADNKPLTIDGNAFYKDWTIWNKERHGYGLGKVTDYVTYYMSGKFYSMLKVKASGRSFEFVSDVPYFNDIILKSGIRTLELSEFNLSFFREEILVPELQIRLKAHENGV